MLLVLMRFMEISTWICAQPKLLRVGSFSLMLWPDISRVGRVTSDGVRGMGVTQFIGAGHIAIPPPPI